MRYRKLDPNGDYTFGQQGANFYQNNPDAVAQAIKTNLGLIQGEWFLDVTLGTPYATRILGMGRLTTYDQAIKETILNTLGVRSISNYTSRYDPGKRAASCSCTVDTIYGALAINMNYSYQYQPPTGASAGILDYTFVLDYSLLG